MAGLLTYSVVVLPSHPPGGGQWHNNTTFKELTAAGTVQDLHLIPSSFQVFNLKKPLTMQIYE